MDSTDLRSKLLAQMAADRPLSTIELFRQNDYYGHATLLKRYALVPIVYQIKAIIEHGARLGNRVHPHELKTSLPAFFTFSSRRHKIIRQHTRKALFSIGPMLHYAPHFLDPNSLKSEKERLGRNLLIFPAHSTRYVDYHYDVHEFCRKIDKVVKEFNSVRVCLYWKDILRGVAKEYMRHGFECVTAGHMYDPQFLPRLKSLIETATITASNCIGTNLGYCIYMGKPYWFLHSALSISAEDQSILGRDFDFEGYTSSSMNELRSVFSQFRNDISQKQQSLISQYWGLDEIRTVEEVQSFLRLSEEMHRQLMQVTKKPETSPTRLDIMNQDSGSNSESCCHSADERAKYTDMLFPFEKPPALWSQAMVTGLAGTSVKPVSDREGRDGDQKIRQIMSAERTVAKRGKLVIVQNGFPGLSATFILDQMTGLIDRGFEVENWATYDPRDSVVHDKVVRYRLMDITRYLRLPPESLFNQPERWVHEFSRLNSIRNWDDIEVFHIHYGLNFNLLHPIFRYFDDKPVLVSMHGHDASRYIRQSGDGCYNDLFDRANLITTPSVAMKEKLVALGCSSDKIAVHHYGIDLDKFRPMQAKSNGAPLILLTVARLVEKKGIEYALQAFAQLPDRSNVCYRIVGDGPLRKDIEALSRSLELQDRVIFLGARSKDEVVREMSAADIYVLTSVTAADGDQEGLPVSLTEAQAMGLPVISTYHAGIPELVEHGRSGFLVPERDVNGTAAYMQRLISDANLRSILSRQAHRRVEEEFDIRKQNDRLAQYIDRLGSRKTLASENDGEALEAQLREKGWLHKLGNYSKHFEQAKIVSSLLSPDISIVTISWRFHPDTLENFKILHQQRDINFELIFVNNGGASDEFDSLQPYVNTYIKLNKNTGAYIARNIGAAFAKAPILLFLEDDGIPHNGFVAAHLEAFKKYDIIAARGVCMPKSKENPLNNLARHYFLGNKPFPRHSDLEGNSSYKASTFFKVGGWDDEINFGCGGTDLSVRLLEIEPDMRKQIYYPHAAIYHDHAVDEEHLKKKRQNQLQSWARLMVKHPGINDFEKKWQRFHQREDLLIPRKPNERRIEPVREQESKAGGTKDILFFMYGWAEEGGGTVRPRHLAKSLVQKGNRVTVIHAAAKNLPGKPAYHVEESWEDGVRLFGVYNRPTLFFDLANPEREANDNRMRSVVSQIIGGLNPDIVHYHNLLGFSMGVAEEVNRAGIPGIYMSRNYWPLCPRLYLLHEDLTLCSGPSPDGNKCASCIGRPNKQPGFARRLQQGLNMLENHISLHLAISSRSREVFIENGCSPMKIQVLQQQPETVDWIWDQAGSKRLPETVLNHRLRVGFIGHVIPMKGVHVLVEAVQAFAPGQVEVHILGSGSEDYIKFLKQKDAKGLVRFHGKFDPGQLPDLLRELDVVVVPSIWEETQCVTVLEALAARIPVIGSRIGGIKDSIDNGVNGFLVEPRNPGDLYNALHRLTSDASLLSRLQKLIKPPRGFESYLGQLVNHYSRVISQSNSSVSSRTHASGGRDRTEMSRNVSDTPTSQRFWGSFSNETAKGELPHPLPSPLYLNVGCGRDIRDGFVNIDLFGDDPRVVHMDVRKLELPDGSADGILASDILEHFPHREVAAVLKEWARVLKPEGKIEIRCPSLRLQLKAYASGVWDADIASYMIFGGQTNPGDFHCVGFDERSIRRHLGKAGLPVLSVQEFDTPQDKGFINLNMTVVAEKPPTAQTAALNQGRPRDALTPLIVWEGSQFVYHSLALINRELCLQLIDAGHEVSIVPYETHQFGPEADPRFGKLAVRFHAPLSRTPDVHVRHQWPPNFTPPPTGHWVMIQPWEFGRLPEEWIRPMSELLDEIWVPSRHVQKSYIASGVPADRVQVVPNGLNTGLFHQGARPYPLQTDKKFKFLFVGGTIWRKGVDVLLEAYRATFRRSDDVVLVIKDIGQDSFYKGMGAAQTIREIQNDPEAPEILYLDQVMSEQDMPGLFTACDCLVHPYRGEGFGLPVLEAMACGIPVVVTMGGATDDFCPPELTYLVSARVINVTFPDFQLVSGAGRVLEPDLHDLKRTLAHIHDNPREAKKKAALAMERVRARYGWENVAQKVTERIKVLSGKPVRRFAASCKTF